MTDRSPTSLSLVLPAWNEAEVISRAIAEADDALRALTDDYEIIVVDDGSTDATGDLVRAAAATNPHVRLLTHDPNEGYGASLRDGFAAATKELVMFTDADCQFDLSELDRFVLLARRYDIVCGYRIDRKDSFLRCFYSKVYNQLVRVLLRVGVRDVDCAMKLFRRDVIQGIEIKGSGFLVNSEILTQANQQGRSVVEVGVTHRPRTEGTSTVSILHIPKVLASLARFWWNTAQFPVESGHRECGGTDWTARQHGWAWAMLMVAAILVLMPNLSYPLIDPDETRYAEIAMEMNASRDWVTPTLDGQPYLDKPPLMYWLTALSLRVLGEHESSARLPSVLAALGTIVISFALGRHLIGIRAAWLGALSLVMSGGFVLAGRFLILDALLAFFVVLSLLAGYVAVQDQRLRWAWWMLSGIACALGVLTKGPIALILCAPPLSVIGWLRQDHTRTRLLHWVAFVIPMLVVCVPWYLAVWRLNPAFGEHFFLQHNWERFTSGSNHREPFWFYVPVLLMGMFPTSLLLPSLGVFLLSKSERKRRLRSKDLGFLFCAAMWILLFFSAASCKLPTYILPALPLIALMVGGMLDQTVFRPELAGQIATYLRPFPQRAALFVAAFAVAVMIADVILADKIQTPIAIAGVVLAAVLVLVLKFWNTPLATSARAWGAWAAFSVVTLTFASTCFMPTAARARSLTVKAAELMRGQPDVATVFFGERSHASQLTLPARTVVYFRDDQIVELAAFLQRHPDAIVITHPESIEPTRQPLERAGRILVATDHRKVYRAVPLIANHPATRKR